MNRVETPDEEPYEVELNKLKEQFESAAKVYQLFRKKFFLDSNFLKNYIM